MWESSRLMKAAVLRMREAQDARKNCSSDGACCMSERRSESPAMVWRGRIRRHVQVKIESGEVRSRLQG